MTDQDAGEPGSRDLDAPERRVPTSVVEAPRPEYPRPRWQRERWRTLNGTWHFATDDDDRGRAEGWHRVGAAELSSGEPFDLEIVVPFAPHTAASGVADPHPHRVVWYARALDVEGLAAGGERLLLHVGAADHDAQVWVDGEHVAGHSGGYTPFHADITDALRAPGDGQHVVVIRVEDRYDDLEQPRGKQYWRDDSEYVFYRGTTGIWQSVWLEPVGVASVHDAKIQPLLDDASVDVAVTTTPEAVGARLRVTIAREGTVFVQDTMLVTDSALRRRWRLTENLTALDAKVLEFQGIATWHPGNPRLYDIDLELTSADGEVLDRVHSYFGMRTVDAHDGQVLLNGRPAFLRLVLDQGFWPDSGYTAPSDEALRADIELAKSMGFNGARKHQKIEDPRWLYWADRLGFVVWEEMPSGYRYSTRYADALTRQWLEVIERDRNHPCVIAWVPMNESWGVPAAAAGVDERLVHHLQAMYHLTKARDATRLVVSNDGWEHAVTDVCTIHDYGGVESLASRLSDRETLVTSRPLHHPIYARGFSHRGEPVVLSEFGGVALDELGWGFHTVRDGDALLERYESYVATVVDSPVVAGFCWTQLCDVEQEANGLLDAWRRPKCDLERVRRATTQRARIENTTRIPQPEDVRAASAPTPPPAPPGGKAE